MLNLRFLFSPLPWLILILLFFWEVRLGILPLPVMAISQESLFYPQLWHTIFTAGLTHRFFWHLLVNLVCLAGLLKISQNRQISPLSVASFIKLGLVLNLLHGLTLAFLIQGTSLKTYIYGSSGIVCGMISFLYARSLDKSLGISRLLLKGFVVIFGFSLLDISFSFQGSLSSWSHLLGLLLGIMLNYSPWFRGKRSL